MCLSDEPLTVPLDEIHIDDKLRFVEELVEIMDREVKRLKQIRIPIIKVRWNSRRGHEFTWEHEDQFRKKYLQLFTKNRTLDKCRILSLTDKAPLTGEDYNNPLFQMKTLDVTLLLQTWFADEERVFWGADEELSNGDSLRVIVYGYEGLPMQPIAPPSPNYVPGPEHPPSPDYMPGPEHPPSPVEVPYVLEPEYPKYLVPSNAEEPLEDQPLPTNASPNALSPGYLAESDPDKDPEEDPEEDHADYPADGGDGDDEPSDDDDDDDDTGDEDEEPFEDEDDDKEEEEHLAPADSSAVHIVDPVSLDGDTKAFETDESAPTPRSPHTRAHIAEHAATPTPPLPEYLHHHLYHHHSLLALLMQGTDIPEAEMPPRKRACFTTPAPGLEIGESSAAGAVRQPWPTLEADTWDEIVEAMMEVAPTTLEGVDQRVTYLATTVRQGTKEFQVRFEEARDDWAFLRARINILFRDRRFHLYTARLVDREAMYARTAWTGSEDRSAAIEAHVRTLEAQVATLIVQTSSLQTQLTTALGRIETLEARDLEPQDEPAEAGSSC
ncbi:hypothetical protein Tco_0649607 [Tanacetum coccineum]